MNPLKHKISALFFLLLFLISCEKETPVAPNPSPEEENTEGLRVGFYNLENLFDTQDDPSNPMDEEFTPEGPKNWTEERYQHKLSNIGRVIEGMDFPALLGVCEVENKTVLRDLTTSVYLKDKNYDFVHEDSPDFRGIDVALLYQTDVFSVNTWEAITVNIPPGISERTTTRDILKVTGTLYDTKIYIYINHWPSRSGGVVATEGKRLFVASLLRAEIDELLQTEPNANILILGDFNDEPHNKSIKEVLKAQTSKAQITDNQLFNCTMTATNQGEGSYNFQGDWQMIDQVIASEHFLNADNTVHVSSFDVYKDDMLLFNHPQYGLSPDRTYGGDIYYGGFSDHLPVYVEIKTE